MYVCKKGPIPMCDSGAAPFPEEPAGSREFLEFRRKVCESEMLSAAMERLLHAIHFSGRLSIVVQNGQVLSPATRKDISAAAKTARCCPEGGIRRA